MLFINNGIIIIGRYTLHLKQFELVLIFYVYPISSIPFDNSLDKRILGIDL